MMMPAQSVNEWIRVKPRTRQRKRLVNQNLERKERKIFVEAYRMFVYY